MIWPETNAPPEKNDRLLDALMEDGVDAENLFGEDGLFKRIKKRKAKRILKTELTDHFGYGKHVSDGRNSANLVQRQDYQDAQGRQRRSAGRDPPRLKG